MNNHSYTMEVITQQSGDQTKIVFASICNIKTKELYIADNMNDILSYIISNGITRIYIQDFNYVASYIFNWLLNNDIPYVETWGGMQTDMGYNCFTSTGGAMYYIKLLINSNKKQTCEFRSARSKTMSTLHDLCKEKAYNVNIMDIDECDDTIQVDSNPSDDIKEYVAGRTVALAMVMEQVLKKSKHLTVGSDAMADWLKRDEKHLPDMPSIPDFIESNFRLAYRGGFNYLNPIYKDKKIDDGLVLDVNSLYPYVMYKFNMPYGLPKYSTDRPLGPDKEYSICHIDITAKLKDKGIPCISSMSSANLEYGIVNEYLDKVKNMEAFVTNFDLELILNNYDIINIDYIDKYVFKHKSGFFNNFIKHHYRIKKESYGAIRQTSKLWLDSLYGRFGIKTNAYKTKPVIDNKALKFINSKQLDDNAVRYLPIAVFITSIARYVMIGHASKVIDRLIYMDTDSLHITGCDIPKDIKISAELGDFKIEERFINAKYLGVKNYIHDVKYDDGIKTIVKMAGAPDLVRNQINWDNFKHGSVIPGKKIMVSMNGGYVRRITKYTIS